MTLRTAFLFSGQGSQYFQMGAPLYRQGGVFKQSMDQMDVMVRDMTGSSIVSTIYGERSKAEVFSDILLTTPAIYMVEIALSNALMDRGIEPALTLGTSLGAFAASVIAGCISIEEGLTLALRKAEIVRAKCAEGGMIAILADPKLFESTELQQYAVIAAHNFSSHFVISAQREHLEGIESFLRVKGHVFQRLPVLYPFHSPWIEPAKLPFLAASESLQCGEASIPIVCSALANRITKLSTDYFWNIARKPILFNQTIAHLEQEGPFQYLDLGPSGSLATFLKYLLPGSSESRVASVMSPYGQDIQNLAAVTARS